LAFHSEREADHSPPSSVEVEEWVELYLHSTDTPSWRGAQGEHRGNFNNNNNNSIIIIAGIFFAVKWVGGWMDGWLKFHFPQGERIFFITASKQTLLPTGLPIHWIKRTLFPEDKAAGAQRTSGAVPPLLSAFSS
jgi:hypothetical protein